MENSAYDLLLWLASNYPIAGASFTGLGLIFLGCELFVKATPGKADDEWWSRVTNGYLGIIVRLAKKFIPK